MTAINSAGGTVADDHTRDDPSRPGTHDVRRDAAAIKDDLGALGRNTADAASRAVREGGDAIRHKADAALRSAREAADHARSGHDRLTSYVRANPTASVFIAIGVGALLGRLLR